MRKMCLILIVLILKFWIVGESQTTPIQGLRDNTPRVHVLMNADIVTKPAQMLPKGIIVVRDGIITAVGEKVVIPADARQWDYSGKIIYSGFIESYAKISHSPMDTLGAKYWNARVHPEFNVISHFKPDQATFQKYRANGFTSALIVPNKGIFRGQSVLVSLNNGKLIDLVIRDKVAQHLAFEQGIFNWPVSTKIEKVHPTSLMGAIALIRQTFLDAEWYRNAHAAYFLNPMGQEAPETNMALENLNSVITKQQAVIFETSDDLSFLRAAKIGKEFGLELILQGNGFEYRQLNAIKSLNIPIILPLNFPEELRVKTPEEALQVDLMDLQHWENAPSNPKWLFDAGVPCAISSFSEKKTEDFHKRLQKAIERGLPHSSALAALTTIPAKLLGVEKQLGSIEVGKRANLVVTNQAIFDKEGKILDVWIDGKRFEVTKQPPIDPRGKWQIKFFLPQELVLDCDLEIKGDVEKLQAEIKYEDNKIPVQETILNQTLLSLLFRGDSLGISGYMRMTGSLKKERVTGKGELPDGRFFNWTGQLIAKLDQAATQSDSAYLSEQIKKPQDFPGAFGHKIADQSAEIILIQGATIWTSGSNGVLENADLLIEKGKITQVGTGLKASPKTVVINANGKHITAGLIDIHSHTAISKGVNEMSQAITAETRISDILNSYDIGIYRELAGGLTVANILHGSANPIGGQNVVIKLRWGKMPDDLIMTMAPKNIKFALGENVKRSNWVPQSTDRFPETRMGVEQIIRDRLKAALDYEKAWYKYRSSNNNPGIIPPRRDLELDALLEVLQNKSFIHCHAYRQDEILMMIRIAEDFDLNIPAFVHVLEGYKVADELAKNNFGATIFSDWWAYKFEAYDAIPYNGALMEKVGVLVSFNSDDPELARRMNTEATKVIKYGGMSPSEALQFVTINPAKQLGIDKWVGSLEPGKDADFVIWSGDPLSTYTICEQTWIEGKKYFDRKEDVKLRERDKNERARLIQKYLLSQKYQTKKLSENQEK